MVSVTHRRRRRPWLVAFLPTILLLLFLAEATLTEVGKLWASQAVSWTYSRLLGGDLTDRYESQHFVIHYTTTGPNASAPAYVRQVAEDLEFSLKRFREMGFLSPVSDSGPAGVGTGRRIPVHLMALEKAYGQSRQWWQFLGKLIRIDPGLSDELRRATAAHELFHQVQNEYMGSNLFTAMRTHLLSRWWMESSATFMESSVYPDEVTYRYFVESYLLDGLYARSLEQIGSGYETVLVNHTLAEAYHEPDDPAVVREVLERLNWRTSPIQAIGEVLVLHGSNWTEFMHRHSLWSARTGAYWEAGFFRDGASYPAMAYRKGYGILPDGPLGAVEEAVTVEAIAFESRLFRTGLETPGDFRLTVERESGFGQGWVVVIANQPGNRRAAVRAERLEFGSAGPGRAVAVVRALGTEGRRVVLLLSNGNPDGPERFTYTATLTGGS